MNDDLKVEPNPKREGVFGKYMVRGNDFRNQNGWDISAQLRDGDAPPHHYWVMNEEFFWTNLSDIRLEVNGLVTDINPEERASVLEAIKKWQKKS